NFSQAFFCHCLGRGKFQAKLFFAIVSGNPAGVGDVGGAMSASACVGTWQAVGSDSASERCGGGVAPRGVRCPSPASYFFGYGSLESLPLCRIDCDGVSSRRPWEPRFAASLRPPPWRRPSPR